jgi:peptide-methionine (S)-S-oxide reductase
MAWPTPDLEAVMKPIGRSLLALALTAALSVGLARAQNAGPGTRAVAVFAGGCFWCVEEAFDPVPGVLATTSGYIGGLKPNPTYKEVSAGGTGHTEAVEVIYDPQQVSYERLLEVFWRNIDPLAENAQFCDEGDQYRSAIFYLNDEQKRQAEASKAALEASKRLAGPIKTAILAASPFFKAEEYHQDYYIKNPLQYRFYKFTCGRAQRLKELWGDVQ